MAKQADIQAIRKPRFKPMRWNLHLPGELILRSMIVQVTDGCHHNKCGFCYTYQSSEYPEFRIVPLEEVYSDFEDTIKQLTRHVPPAVFNKAAFLCDADPLVRPTDDILTILEFLYGFDKTFDDLGRSVRVRLGDTLKTVATYARFDTLLKKKSDLGRLKKAGLTDIYLGIESGDDAVLRDVNKGYDTAAIKEAFYALKEQGYGCHVFVISGLGGKERTYGHAQKTAELLNELVPDTMMISPLTLSAITPLGKKYEAGEFQDLTIEERIEEEKRLLAALEFPLDLAVKLKFMGCFRCSEVGYEGVLPADKENALEWLANDAIKSSHYLSCAPDGVGAGHQMKGI